MHPAPVNTTKPLTRFLTRTPGEGIQVACGGPGKGPGWGKLTREQRWTGHPHKYAAKFLRKLWLLLGKFKCVQIPPNCVEMPGQGLGRFPDACLCLSRFHLPLARPGGTRRRAPNGVEAHAQTPVQTRGKRESCSSVPCTILGEVKGCSRDGEGLHGGLTGQSGPAAGTANPLPGTGCTYRVGVSNTR